MPSVAAVSLSLASAGASQAGSAVAAGSTESFGLGGDFMAAFMASLERALGSQLPGAAETTERTLAGDTAAQSTVETDAATRAALLAALQQPAAAGDAAGATPDAETATARDRVARLMALLGLAPADTAANQIATPPEAGARTDGDAAADTQDGTDPAAALPDAAVLIATLLGQTPPPPTQQQQPAGDAADTLAAKPVAPRILPEAPEDARPPADPAPARHPAAQAQAPAFAVPPTFASLLGEQTAAAPVPETASEPAATAAEPLVSTETQQKPAASRTEARMRRIAAEIAALTGGNGPSGPIGIKGEVKPVESAGSAAAPHDKPPGGIAIVTHLAAALTDPAARDDSPLAPAPAADLAANQIAALPAGAQQAAAGLDTPAATPAPLQSDKQAAPAITLPQLAQAIAAHAAKRETRFEIRLDPAELGKIDVSLAVRHDGTVRAHLIVERPDTLDMMLHDQQNLARALESNGLSVSSGGLEFSLQQHARDHRGADLPATPAAIQPEMAEEALPEAAAVASAYSRAGPSGLDLRI